MYHLVKFFTDEDAAVTVDWVVLTATLGMLGIAVQVGLGTATNSLADKISTNLDSVDIMTF